MNKYFQLAWYQEVLTRHNPYGFTVPNTDKIVPLDFPNIIEAYKYTLERLYLMFPRGYIDLTLFVAKNTPLDFRDAERYVATMKRLGIEKDVILIDGWTPSKKRDSTLKLIFIALHTATYTPFQEGFFLTAVNWFNVTYNLEH